MIFISGLYSHQWIFDESSLLKFKEMTCCSDEAERHRHAAEPDGKKHLRLPGENLRSDHRQEVAHTHTHLQRYHRNTQKYYRHRGAWLLTNSCVFVSQSEEQSVGEWIQVGLFNSLLLLFWKPEIQSVVSSFSLFFSLQVRRLLIGRQEHSGPPTSQWDRRRNRTSQKDLWVTEGQSETLRLLQLYVCHSNQSNERPLFKIQTSDSDFKTWDDQKEKNPNVQFKLEIKENELLLLRSVAETECVECFRELLRIDSSTVCLVSSTVWTRRTTSRWERNWKHP